MKRPEVGDAWYESEEPTRAGMVTELQRIKRRTRVAPIRVILLAALVTAAVTYKFATKRRLYEADIVLAVSEGSMSSRSGIPFDQLQQYVNQVLLPDNKLIEVIERHDLHRLRKTLGPQYAIEELRSSIELDIWKNSFVYFHEADARAMKSARIGLTVIEEDPDTAFEVARDLASIIINEHDRLLAKAATEIAAQMALARESLTRRAIELTSTIAIKQQALVKAKIEGNTGLAAVLLVDVAALSQQEKTVRDQLGQIVMSPEAIADRAAAAGLDTTVTIVEERRPPRQEQSGLALAMVIVIIGTGALIGSAMLLGAFDSRVHDTDDVARLGLPVLGHVPGFPGDHVGSLEARAVVRRARVPSFLRWRS